MINKENMPSKWPLSMRSDVKRRRILGKQNHVCFMHLFFNTTRVCVCVLWWKKVHVGDAMCGPNAQALTVLKTWEEQEYLWHSKPIVGGPYLIWNHRQPIRKTDYWIDAGMKTNRQTQWLALRTRCTRLWQVDKLRENPVNKTLQVCCCTFQSCRAAWRNNIW